MGTCCIRENNIIHVQAKPRGTIKSKMKSTRSSIYQINKEDIHDVYDFCGKISSGYYGTVYKACFKNDPSKFYAVKTIAKSNLSQKNLKNLILEIQVLAKLDHPNIVKYYETYDDEKYFSLVMEYCEGGELYDRIVKNKKLKEKNAAEILFKLTHAISHCHSRGIVHRDMKAENVLFETKSEELSDVKIIDFGLARKRGDHHNLHSIVGTPCYVAPEVLEGAYDRKCDIWALGVIFYVMLFGKYPFNEDNKSALFEKIRNQEPNYNSTAISSEAKSLLQLMLTKDPQMRPEAVTVLDNPFFVKYLRSEFKDSVKDLEMIPRLKGYKAPNAFIKKMIQFLVKEVQTPEVEELRNKFYIMDNKKNGVVDLAKYVSHIDTKAIASADSTKKNQESDSNLFGDCLLNKFIKSESKLNIASPSTGKIDYTSFMAANFRDKNLITKEMIQQLFLRLDVNNLGYINVSGFHKALRRTGKKLTEEEAEKMLNDAGFANTNNIQFDEFLHVIGSFLWD